MALGSAVYMNGSLMGEFIGAGLTLPVVMPLTGESWRLSFTGYALPAFAIALGLLFLGGKPPPSARRPGQSWLPRWKDARVWQMGLLLGANGSVFFGINAYMGTLLNARGDGDLLALTLSLFNITQVFASLLMLAVARHLLRRRLPIVCTVFAITAGTAMFTVLGTQAAIAGALVVGFTSALQLILLVSLPPQLFGSDEAGPLAAGMFTIGYATAFVVPLIGGLVADALHQPGAVMIPILALAVLAIPVALRFNIGGSAQ
jgi:CP family cyanate transporter-like MFS transporter